MSEMTKQPDVCAKAPMGKSEYVTGWFSRQLDAGRAPTYGYPPNHLPEVRAEPLQIQTSYIAALEAESVVTGAR